LEELKPSPPSFGLVTRCAGALTAIIAHACPQVERHFSAHRRRARLGNGNASEEIEPKGVAYDTFLAATGSSQLITLEFRTLVDAASSYTCLARACAQCANFSAMASTDARGAAHILVSGDLPWLGCRQVFPHWL